MAHSRFVYISALSALLCTTFVHATTPLPKPQESFAPYWTAEPGWETELQLKNNLAESSLTVTPVLRLADGREIPLDSVTIPSNTVASIEVNDALSQRAAARPVTTQLYGSVAFRYTAKNAKNLYAAVMIHMHGQPIGYHVDVYPVYTEPRASSMEGIWWRPGAGVKDYLVLSNSFAKPMSGTLSLFDANGKRWSERLTLSSHQMQRMSVGELLRTAGLTGSYGGIKFEVTDNAGAVDSVHLLYDETSGFSAMMKMFERDPSAKLEERTWAGNKQWTMWAPMLALQSPDAAVGFPPGILLQPKIFVYNPTNRLVTANISLSWRGDSGQGKAALPALQLRPYASQLLEIGPMQKKLAIPDDAHWALVTLTSPALPDSIIAAAASYDASLRYGAQTPFSDQLSHQWMGGEWQVDSTHNTISAIGNGGTRATEALVTLHYNQGTEKYEIQKIIQPGDQLWLNLGELIRHNIPDAKGHTMPANLQSGTYDIVDLIPGIGGNLFEGKVILDKTYGHLAYGCVECCEDDYAYLMQDPTGVFINGAQEVDAFGDNSCTGFQDNLNSYYRNGTWWTGNSGIATMSSLRAQGVSAGTTSGYAKASIPRQAPHSCPLGLVQAANGLNVCGAPSTELTQVAGTAASKGYPAATEFNQTISDASNDSFDGRTVEEMSGGPGVDTCYWAGNSIGLLQYPVVTGGVWTVAGDDVPGQHNHWEYDVVGYSNSAGPAYIRTYGPAHGISIPCTQTLFQNMVISCDTNTNYNYATDSLTITINASTSVTNCRAAVCQTINGY